VREILGGVAFLLVAGMALYWGRGLSLGKLRLPGPGALPCFAAVGIVILSLALVVQGIRKARGTPHSSGEKAESVSGGLTRIAVAVALIAAYAVALSWAGFLVSTVILATALFMLGAPRPMVWSSLAFGICLAGGSYLLFVRLLDIKMPIGSLWGH
jgi:hypothetical protein